MSAPASEASPRTLLIGRAGSGKTHRVVAAVRQLLERGDRGGRYERFAVIVPTYSQAEHMKRRLLRGQDGLPALLDRGIGTFEQLAERETGVRLSGLASGAVQDALLQRALARVAVPEFEAVRGFPGFRAAALRFVKEIKSSEVEPGAGRLTAAADRIVAAAASLPPARGAKVAGLARVVVAYQDELRHAGLRDHEDLLHELLLALREDQAGMDGALKSEASRLALTAVDGFTDLTQLQERIVQLLIERSDRAIVTLLGDASRDDRGAAGVPSDAGALGPFAVSRALRAQLVAGSRLAVELLPGTARLCGDLGRVERAVSDHSVEPAAPDGSVRIVAGADPADEADRVARLCRRFAADGVARRDILVVVRHMNGATGGRIRDALRHHGVPHRCVGGAPLLAAPVARSAFRLLGLLSGAIEGDAARLALSAGDARGVPDCEADRVVHVARARGLRTLSDLHALALEEESPGAAAWLASARAVRARVVPEEAAREPLLEVDAAPHLDVAESVLAMLVAVPELLETSYQGTIRPSDGARAAADAAAMCRTRDIVADALAGHRVSAAAGGAAEVVRSARAAAERARTRAVDRRIDAVNLVDAEESRTWEAAVVIVAGLRMGEFPAATAEDVFVRDDDRETLRRSTGVRLPTRMDRALHRERFLFYCAVTRARNTLVLTTSSCDERGEAAVPSPFLERVLSVFPAEQRRPEGADRAPGDVRPADAEIAGERDLTRAAIAALSERHPTGSAGAGRQDVAVCVLQEVVARAVAENALPVLRGGHALIRAARARLVSQPVLSEDSAARAHLARRAARSSTSLSDFAQCPYRHFARKGLGLRESPARPEDGVDALTQGNVAHGALQRLFDDRRDAQGDPDAVQQVFDAEWERFAGEAFPSLTTERARLTLQKAVADALEDDAQRPPLANTVRQEVEQPFGAVGDGAGGRSEPVAVRVPDGTEVPLLGRVDRVDHDADGNVVVLDYKTSRSERYAGLPAKIAAGLDLQLPIYVLAMRAARNLRVVGAAYLTLRDRRRRWLWLGDADKAPKSSVIWSDDPEARLSEVAAIVGELDGRIRGGEILVAPVDPDRCPRCPYTDLCRVEEQP